MLEPSANVLSKRPQAAPEPQRAPLPSIPSARNSYQHKADRAYRAVEKALEEISKGATGGQRTSSRPSPRLLMLEKDERDLTREIDQLDKLMSGMHKHLDKLKALEPTGKTSAWNSLKLTLSGKKLEKQEEEKARKRILRIVERDITEKVEERYRIEISLWTVRAEIEDEKGPQEQQAVTA